MVLHDTFRFNRCPTPCLWDGIYNTTKSDDNVFHIWARYNDLPVIKWKQGNETAECPAKNSRDVQNLADAINSIKVKQTRYKRGSFIINEFGNVIVPFVNSNQKICVGNIEGELLFTNSFGSGYFSLNDDENFKTGDSWNKPYIGIPYNYSPSLGIHFIDEDGSKYQPAKQDAELIRKIQTVRGYNYIRFIVNPHGIALTKVQPALIGPWRPAYIGRINYDKWFDPYCE